MNPRVPNDIEQAVELRNALIAEVQRIQEQLGEPSKQMDTTWRRSAIRALNAKQAELRAVKEWMRQNDSRRQSEWVLFGRLYRFLERLKRGDAEADEEMDVLLDAIEHTVPQQYLEEKRS